MPYAASCLLERGLWAFVEYWPGWKVTKEALVSPDGWTINRNHALSVPLMEAQIKQRDARIKELEAAHAEAIARLQAEVAYLKSVHALQDQPDPSDSIPQILTG